MYWRLLRGNRDFRLLYAGTLISLGGDWFLTVALLDLVLSLTGSATLASLMLLCQTLPIFVVTPFAGTSSIASIAASCGGEQNVVKVACVEFVVKHLSRSCAW